MRSGLLSRFACAISAMYGLNALAKGSVWWAQWPLLGWGAGLLVQYVLKVLHTL